MFAGAASFKLSDPVAFEAAATAMVPEALRRVVVTLAIRATPCVEALVALLLTHHSTRRVGAVGASIILVAFGGVILASPSAICPCTWAWLGPLAANTTPHAIARNLVLLCVALCVIVCDTRIRRSERSEQALG